MFERIIQFAIEQRLIVMLAVLLMAGLGLASYQKLPIDAVPDITNTQVQINTSAPALSPSQVETQVTFPIETGLAGIEGLEMTRSISRSAARLAAGRPQFDRDTYRILAKYVTRMTPLTLRPLSPDE